MDFRALNTRAAEALARARTYYLGLEHRVDMAALLNKATGGQGPDVSTYNRWEEETRRIPAWALLLVAEVVSEIRGVPVSVSQLLAEPADDEQLLPEHVLRLRRVEEEIREMKAEVRLANEERRQERQSRRRPAAG